MLENWSGIFNNRIKIVKNEKVGKISLKDIHDISSFR